MQVIFKTSFCVKMDGEEEVRDLSLISSPPRPPLAVVLRNPRENGVLEFLAAIQDGKLDEAKVIFEAKKVNPSAIGPQEKCGLHLAARAGFLDCVNFLLEAGADVNIKEPRGKYPLHLAASSGHLDIIKALIKAGSRLNDVDKFGRSPLMWAAAGGYVDAVKLLLEAGASFTSQGNNWHALHEACKGGYTDLVQLLIEAGAPVNNPTQYSGGAPWSPLHIAVRQGHLECVTLLIKAGANVNSVNAGGHTPAHEAAYRGYDNVLLKLLLCGANPNAVSNQKRTPLHEACIQGKVKCSVLLLDAGSNVNVQDLVMETPLHLTLRANHAYDIAVQLTTILLQYGASPSLPGRDDYLPFDIARETGQLYCIDLLENALEIPQPLLQICKVSLRKYLSCHLEVVEELPLPLTLKNYLTIEL